MSEIQETAINNFAPELKEFKTKDDDLNLNQSPKWPSEGAVGSDGKPVGETPPELINFGSQDSESASPINPEAAKKIRWSSEGAVGSDGKPVHQ